MTMEAGKHVMRGLTGGLGTTKGGAPQIGVSLVVTKGPFEGEQITAYGYFTDASKDITFRMLRTLGWQGDDISNLVGIDKNEVTVIVAEEEYQGTRSLKVKGIFPLGGAGLANPMSDSEAKAFAATVKGDAVASRTSVASSPNQKPKGKPAREPGDDTDDLGF